MSTDWRISTFNGALLAAYFVPTWTIVALQDHDFAAPRPL